MSPWRIIRDSRREYLQLRSLLLAPLQPTRTRAACLSSLDPQKRDKTRQNPNAPETTSLPTNDLQQPEPDLSHSGTVENQHLINTPLQRGEPTQPTAALTASAVFPASSPASAATDQSKIPNPKSNLPPPRLCGEPPVTHAKKHKPYWLNGHYYENPEYPENIARAMTRALTNHQSLITDH